MVCYLFKKIPSPLKLIHMPTLLPWQCNLCCQFDKCCEQSPRIRFKVVNRQVGKKCFPVGWSRAATIGMTVEPTWILNVLPVNNNHCLYCICQDWLLKKTSLKLIPCLYENKQGRLLLVSGYYSLADGIM